METLVYESFADIGEPEPFTDQDGNAGYNSGEPFVDVNGNGQWDEDMGEAGLGGPSDVVVYRLSYDWGIDHPVHARVHRREHHPRLQRSPCATSRTEEDADATPHHPPRARPARHRGDGVRADPAHPGHVQRRDDRVQPADHAHPEAAERRLHPRRPRRARQDAERGAAREHLPRHRPDHPALRLRDRRQGDRDQRRRRRLRRPGGQLAAHRLGVARRHQRDRRGGRGRHPPRRPRHRGRARRSSRPRSSIPSSRSSASASRRGSSARCPTTSRAWAPSTPCCRRPRQAPALPVRTDSAGRRPRPSPSAAR